MRALLLVAYGAAALLVFRYARRTRDPEFPYYLADLLSDALLSLFWPLTLLLYVLRRRKP